MHDEFQNYVISNLTPIKTERQNFITQRTKQIKSGHRKVNL